MVDVFQHGYIDVPSCAVPLQDYSEVEGACSVDGGGILRVESVVEVVKVGTGGDTDTKFIDHECEGSGAY